MRRKNYKVGDLILYGDVSDEDLACVGLVTVVYWDKSVMVLDPYALDEGREEYNKIEADEIIRKIHRKSDMEELLIDLLESVMPLESWLLLSLGASIIIEIVRRIM